MPRLLSTLRRILPATSRRADTEITNPITAPSWAPQSAWLVDRSGSVFVRLA
ncbi:MAG: hypothetical protein WCJ64_27125 [Rhodospirillaceae bacterium]